MSDNSDKSKKKGSIEELAMPDRQLLNNEDVKRIKKLEQIQSDMTDRLIDNFRKNIEAFEKYLPDIARTFKNYIPKRTIEFFCSENGIANLVFTDDNDIFYKTDDPFSYCANQVESALKHDSFYIVKYQKKYDCFGQIHFRYLNETVDAYSSLEIEHQTPELTGSIPNCIMLGIGLGYPLAELYSRVEIINLIAIEPDMDLFFASLHAFDWAYLLEYVHENNFGLYLMVGQTPERLYDEMNQFYVRHGRFLSGYFWGFAHYHSDTILKMKQAIMKDYTRTFDAMGFFDDHMFGISHALYAIEHHKHFVSIPHSVKDKDIFKLPVFIVGSGPSLDADIPFLRKNQDKAVIIACGTALDSLYHAGIKPDFYACTERTPMVADSILNIPDKSFLEDIILLACDVVHPYTQDIFRHTGIFLKPNEPFYWMVVSKIPGAKNLNSLQLINPLVGNMGLSAALYMGFSKLYLFGLDNGRKVGQKLQHSKYTRLYRDQKAKNDSGSCRTSDMVPGNFGGMCVSDPLYKMSIRNMEVLLELFKDKVSCYNCSDGSMLNGALPTHSSSLNFESNLKINKDELHRFFIDSCTREIEADSAILDRAIGRKEFCDLIDKFKFIWKTEPNNRVEFIKNMEISSEIISYLQKIKEGVYQAYFLEGTMQCFFIIMLRTLYLSSDEASCMKLAKKILKIYLNFLDDAAKLYVYLPNYVLGPHQKILSGKVGFDHEDSIAPKVPVIPSIRTNNEGYDKKFKKQYI